MEKQIQISDEERETLDMILTDIREIFDKYHNNGNAMLLYFTDKVYCEFVCHFDKKLKFYRWKPCEVKSKKDHDLIFECVISYAYLKAQEIILKEGEIEHKTKFTEKDLIEARDKKSKYSYHKIETGTIDFVLAGNSECVLNMIKYMRREPVRLYSESDFKEMISGENK